MIRSVVAVLVGLAVSSVLYLVGAVLAFVVHYGIPLGASPGEPSPGYMTTNLALSMLAAIAGGSAAARMAGRRPLAHGVGLALAIVVLVLWGFGDPASQWPRWYPYALLAVGVTGSIAGAALRGRSSRAVRVDTT